MKKQWEQLEAWLKTSNPALLDDLNPPASDAKIQALEKKIRVTLPTDFVECLKVHDGQRGQAECLFQSSEFLSSERILDEWTIWKDLWDRGDFDDADARPEPGIQSTWWNPKWIPFTYNGTGDHLCLDLDPAPNGQTGQIITLWHDDGSRNKKANSFSQWFTEFVNRTTY